MKIFSPIYFIVGIIVAFLSCSPSLAIDTADGSGWDLSIHLAGVVGSIAQSTIDSTTQAEIKNAFNFGGTLLGIALNRDLARWLTAWFEVHLVMDVLNVQITRTGFDLGAAIHLLGGARRTFVSYGSSELMVRDPYNLSLVIKTGFHSYAASNTKLASQVEGSVFDTQAGLQYRFDLNNRNAIAIEGTASVASVPADVERLKTTIFTIGAAWRIFL